MKTISKEKKKFVHGCILKGAISAAVNTRSQKNPVYSLSRIERSIKAELVSFWKEKLVEYATNYIKEKKDSQYFITDVLKFQSDINKSFKDCFYNNEGIRIAQCQKSLSVYLKWLWCLGELKYEPPVCPIDRYVLSECRRHSNEAQRAIIDKVNKDGGWGAINDPDTYEKLVAIIEDVSKSAAVWELFFYNREVLFSNNDYMKE